MADIAAMFHRFVSEKSQSPDPTLVSTNEWNDGLTLSGGSTGQLLGYSSANNTYKSFWYSLPTISVDDPPYNAAGDYTGSVGTDDTAAFQAAITDCLADGKMLKLGCKWYNISSELLITLTQFTQGFGIIGERYDRTYAPSPIQRDSRLFFTSSNAAHSCIRVVSNPAGTTSFMPIVLRNFGVQSGNSFHGIARGITTVGVSVMAENVGCNLLLQGWQITGCDNPQLWYCAAQRNKTFGLRFGPDNTFEALVVGGMYTENSTEHHGGSTPYTGKNVWFSGGSTNKSTACRAIRVHTSGGVIGWLLEDCRDITIDECYSEATDDGLGVSCALSAGPAASTSGACINPRVINLHSQNEQFLLDKVQGGRVEATGPLTRTANTLNVDLSSIKEPELNPHVEVSPETYRCGNIAAHPNAARDGFFIYQYDFSQTLFIDQGTGTGTATVGFAATTPFIPARGYTRFTCTTAATRAYWYPLTFSRHSLKTGVRVYCQVTHRRSSTANAHVRLRFQGVDDTGVAATAVETSDNNLVSSDWVTSKFQAAVPDTAGFDTVTAAYLVFEFFDSGNFDIASVVACLSPEPNCMNPQDATFAFPLVTNSAAPIIYSALGPEHYLLFLQNRDAGIDVYAAVVSGHWEITKAAGGAVTTNVLAIPQRLNGY